MKWFWVYIIFFAPFWLPCNSKQKKEQSQKESLPLAIDSASTIDTSLIDFSSQVKPIFVSRCSPCHFPGGKMYSRMPFDQDTTIISHEAGILRRIKDEKDNALIKSFIAQHKALK